MNLNQLRTFAAVARQGNITRAAEQLSVSQPAVSKQLAELELDLGTILFDRLPRGVRLTGAGRLLRGHAERILAEEAQAQAELMELAGLHRGQLSIGASTTIGSYLVPSLFGEFKRIHPGVGLELVIANTSQIQTAVLEGRLDLGLTEGFVSSGALEVEQVASDEMVMIAAPGHALLRETPLRPERLASLPFILREQGSGTRDVIEAALSERGIRIKPIMSLGSTEAVKNAVASGLGFAMVSRLAVELEILVGRLSEVPINGLTIRRALHLLRLRGKHSSAAVVAFLDVLQRRGDSEGGTPPGTYAI